MAGQQKVQEYLLRHRIGALFEDLMGQLVSEQPHEPYPFLMQLLERKATRLGYKASALRRSTGDLNRGGRAVSPDPAVRKSMPASAWAAGDAAVAKDRVYQRPWSTNAKRTPTKSAKDPKKSGPGRSPSKAVDVDDLWGSKGRSGSPSKRLDWRDPNEDEDLLYMSRGYRGPRRSDETDPLAGEFRPMKEKPVGTKAPTAVVSYKNAGLRGNQAQQRLKYENMLKKASQKGSDSGFEDEKDLDPDNAVELTEDVDALRAEGVSVKNMSGVRMNKVTRRSTSSRECEPQVRVSICARCAKVMTGGEPSEPAEGTQYGELPEFEGAGDTDFDISRPQSSARVSAFASEDEEFESVSQVTGPRQPVWNNEDSDDDIYSATARKPDSYMFKHGAKTSKGRPMYSGRGDPLANADVHRSYASARSPTGESRSARDLRATWSPGVAGQSDSEDEADDVRVEGGGWNVPATDYDSEASTDITYGRGGAKGKAPGGRNYMGAF